MDVATVNVTFLLILITVPLQHGKVSCRFYHAGSISPVQARAMSNYCPGMPLSAVGVLVITDIRLWV
jgi:hypothetical protein